MEIKDCFVIMPFSDSPSHSEDKWTEIFEKLFKPAWNTFDVNCFRIKVARGSITKEIIEKLYSASVVFADLTDSNPNVMYELGVRHTFKKPSVMVREKGAVIPFDVNDYNVFEYEYTSKGLEDLKEHIGIVIQDIKTHPNRSDNPVWDFRNTSDFLVDYYRSIETIQKLEALKEEFESNLQRCDEFLGRIKNTKIPKDFKDWSTGTTRLSQEEEQELQASMEAFYPVIRNDALTHLKITKYVNFTKEDWSILNEIDNFFRWCGCYSSNLSTADFYECERLRIDEIREVIREGMNIISRRISELQAK